MDTSPSRKHAMITSFTEMQNASEGVHPIAGVRNKVENADWL